MDLDRLVERNDEDETGEKLKLNFYTEAETDAIREALEFVSAACINSKHSIAEVNQETEGEENKEFIVIDCEDSDHQTTQGLMQELIEFSDYDYELGASNRNPDVLYVVADLPDEFVGDDGKDE